MFYLEKKNNFFGSNYNKKRGNQATVNKRIKGKGKKRMDKLKLLKKKLFVGLGKRVYNF